MNSRTAIITGASSGIGKATAEVFAAKGWNVVAAARNGEKLQAALSAIPAERLLAIACDVSSEAGCKDLIEKAVARFHSVDVLMNNAGISMRASFEKLDLKVLEAVMQVNFWGTVYCTKYALPHLLRSKGSVIGISSIAGKKGLPGRTGYSASKFAMEGFLETLRIENMKKDLHVMVVCPGFTSTSIRQAALTADGSVQAESPRDESKMMSADKVAVCIYNAMLKRKRDLILTFDGRMTVLLNKFLPSLMDRIVFNHMSKEPDAPF